jgi:hypothetical protein
MKAKEARERARQVNNDTIQSEVLQIHANIVEAAESGKFSITFYNKLFRPETIKTIKVDGYEVEVVRSGIIDYDTVISWDE